MIINFKKIFCLVLTAAFLLLVGLSSAHAQSNDNGMSSENYSKPYVTMPILMYHYIRDYYNQHDPIGVGLSVSPACFAKQLQWLQANDWQTMTFGDIKNKIAPAASKKPIILTFDDGYQDFYDNVWPLLQKYHAKAVAFVIVNALDKPGYLTKAEVKTMADSGLVEIGSHTLNHIDLAGQPEKRLKIEINDSKTELEKIINQPVVSFCYPSGRYDQNAIKEVEVAGYSFATTTHGGLANLAQPFWLKRLRMAPGTDISKILTYDFGNHTTTRPLRPRTKN